MENKDICKYCDDNNNETFIFDNRTKSSYKGSFNPGISVSIFDGNMNVEAVGDTYEPSYEEAKIKINYCPMCGRKLGGKYE